MKSLETWLSLYSESHRNPTNKKIHNVCVPLIMFSLLGMLWTIPTPDLGLSHFAFNWANVFIAFCMIFYFMLDFKMAVMIFFTILPMFGALYYLHINSLPMLKICITIFVLAWIGQFIGHKIEGKKPSFFEDIQFLLIGPLWVFRPLFLKLFGSN